MLHDLRRTFITLADELEIHPGVVKALVNHRSNDVTDGYTIRSVERLRHASQQIATRVLYYVKDIPTAVPPLTVQSLTRDAIFALPQAVCSPPRHRQPEAPPPRQPLAQQAESSMRRPALSEHHREDNPITEGLFLFSDYLDFGCHCSSGPATPAEVHCYLSRNGRVRFNTIIEAIKDLIEREQVVLVESSPFPSARVTKALSVSERKHGKTARV